MKITTKYRLRQKVFLVRLSMERVTRPCKACTGHGRIQAKDSKWYTCPGCGGSGCRVTRLSPVYVADPEGREVLSIRTNTCMLGTTVVYLVAGTEAHPVINVEEPHAYGSIEEAAAGAQRLTGLRFTSIHARGDNLDAQL